MVTELLFIIGLKSQSQIAGTPKTITIRACDVIGFAAIIFGYNWI